MTLPSCKKVTFQETPNIGEPQNLDPNYNEEPYATLNDPSHRCPSPLPPDVKFVNPCNPDVAGEVIQPTKNQEVSGGKSVPCNQTQSQKPQEDTYKTHLPSENKPKVVCPVNTNSGKPEPEMKPYDDTPAHQRLSDKLKQMRIEEDFRRENPIMRRQVLKYHGICGTLGNPVFTNTPMTQPGYKAKSPANVVPRYPQPTCQHPLYKTTSADYGSCKPYLESTPIFFHPNDQSFTTEQGIGGVYEDAHLTTELDHNIMW